MAETDTLMRIISGDLSSGGNTFAQRMPAALAVDPAFRHQATMQGLSPEAYYQSLQSQAQTQQGLRVADPPAVPAGGSPPYVEPYLRPENLPTQANRGTMYRNAVWSEQTGDEASRPMTAPSPDGLPMVPFNAYNPAYVEGVPPRTSAGLAPPSTSEGPLYASVGYPASDTTHPVRPMPTAEDIQRVLDHPGESRGTDVFSMGLIPWLMQGDPTAPLPTERDPNAFPSVPMDGYSTPVLGSLSPERQQAIQDNMGTPFVPSAGLTPERRPSRDLPSSGPSGATAGANPDPMVSALRSEAAYDSATGMRPAAARELSIFERVFGPEDSDRRAAMSKALIMAGAQIMQTPGGIGTAIAKGIEAGAITYDTAIQALRDEAREARQMDMEEEAFAIEMQLKQLQLARLQAQGTGGAGGVDTGTSTAEDIANSVADLRLAATMVGAPDPGAEMAYNMVMADRGTYLRSSQLPEDEGLPF